MVHKQILLFCFLCLLSATTKAQSCFSIEGANDYLNRTDRYYTQGLRLTYIHPVFTKPVEHLFPELTQQTTIKLASVDLFQDIYTPHDYYTPVYDPNARPYAAVLAGTYRYAQYSIETRKTLRLNVLAGLIGKQAMGELIQNGFHDMIDNAHAEGWEYQIKSGALINMGAMYEYDWLNKSVVRLSGLLGAEVGTYKINAQLGLGIKLGKNRSILGLPLQRMEGKKLTHQLEIQSVGYAVGYDATLQGALWQNTTYGLPADKIKRFLWNSKAEYRVLYRSFQVGLAQSIQTPDFDGGLWHKWMTLNLAYWF